MTKRPGAIAIALAAGVAATGLLAATAGNAQPPPNCGPPFGCTVALTATGPSPGTVTMFPEGNVLFSNPDSVAHEVVFANGLCSLAVPPDGSGVGCADRFEGYVGSYAFTVDGKYSGALVTTPFQRSVTLRARAHRIRAGARLTLQGEVTRSNSGAAPPPPVIVLARHTGEQTFEHVATVRTRGSHETTYTWRLVVRPDVATTYIAEVTAQRLCYYPASRCGHPQGQVWTNAKSRPFPVRIRQKGSK